MTKVIKRNGIKEAFDPNKVRLALEKAQIKNIEQIVHFISTNYTDLKNIEVENIQNDIEHMLLTYDPEGYKRYHSYREERSKIRLSKSNLMKTVHQLGICSDKDNGNVGGNFSAKLLRIASVTNKSCNLSKMPKRFSRLHEQGWLYYHDLDSLNLTINCLHIDLGSILSRGFDPGYGRITPPKRIETAAELACIILQAQQNDQFGGVSYPDFDNDLAPYVRLTRKEIEEEYGKFKACMSSAVFDSVVEEKLISRVRQSMQGICFNLNTLHSRAGSQVPFSSLNFGIPKSKEAAMITKLLLEEYNKGMGNGEQLIFPNLAFKVKSGVNRNPGDPYYDLFVLACDVAANRLNPTFLNIDHSYHAPFYEKGIVASVMGCRTAVCSNVNGKEGPASRGNIFPTTINLVRLGIEAKHNPAKFFSLLKEQLKNAEDFTLYRYNILKNLTGKDLPFGVGQGLLMGSENIGIHDSIEPVLKHGTYGIGFIGLAECLIALTGHHHAEDSFYQQLGLKIIEYINNYCKYLTEKYSLNFACYATPAEGLSGVFIKHDRAKYGKIEGVTTKDYYTNSYAVPVNYRIGALEKLALEAPYHRLCTGGHISYVEFDRKPTGEVVRKLITKAYMDTDIDYVGINFHKRFCKDCGKDLLPDMKNCQCGSYNIQGISRITGYLALDERFGPGKEAERKDRISHNTHKNNYYL